MSTVFKGRRQNCHYLDLTTSSGSGWQRFRPGPDVPDRPHRPHRQISGVDHVGLGSDFDGVSGATPAGIDSAADLPKITQGLLDRGYRSDDIKKSWWKPAARLRESSA